MNLWGVISKALTGWAAKALSGVWGLVFNYLVMPLLSKGWTALMKWWAARQRKTEREKQIDEDITKIEESTTPEEQENALDEMARRARDRRPRP